MRKSEEISERHTNTTDSRSTQSTERKERGGSIPCTVLVSCTTHRAAFVASSRGCSALICGCGKMYSSYPATQGCTYEAGPFIATGASEPFACSTAANLLIMSGNGSHTLCHSPLCSRIKACVQPKLLPLQRAEDRERPRPTLIVWRSRFQSNFGDFAGRVLQKASWLAGLAQAGRPLHFFLAPADVDSMGNPINMSLTEAQPFHWAERWLAPFGSVNLTIDTIINREFAGVWRCCINTRGFSHAARLSMVNATLKHFSIEATSAEKAASTTYLRVLFAQRTESPRRIFNLDALLEQCQHHYALRCRAVDFARMTFRKVVQLVNLETDVLVGMHGAELANGYFMRNGMALIEIFGRSFGRPGSYGLRNYAGLFSRSGLIHERLVVPESDDACAQRAEAYCAPFHLRPHACVLPIVIDCAVKVSWDELLRVLSRIFPAGIRKTAQPDHPLPVRSGHVLTDAECNSTVDAMIGSAEYLGATERGSVNSAQVRPASLADDLVDVHALLARCATRGTVIGTVASASYALPLRQLALSAAEAGLGRIAVQPMDKGFPWAHAPLMESMGRFCVLQDMPRPFLPREQWCDKHGSARYGWRRAHVYKMLLWVTVLESGHNLLGIDCDWSLRSNPLPKLLAAHILASRPDATTTKNFTRVEPLRPQLADFVALFHDGINRRQLNIGVVFIRSNSRTIALAQTTLNRSFGAQDQPVVNEELNWGHLDVSCCFIASTTSSHVPAAYRQPLARACEQTITSFVQNRSTHATKNRLEPGLRCGDSSRRCAHSWQISPAHKPPKLSPYAWRHLWNTSSRQDQNRWEPSAYNSLTLRPVGRCSRLDNACGLCR